MPEADATVAAGHRRPPDDPEGSGDRRISVDHQYPLTRSIIGKDEHLDAERAVSADNGANDAQAGLPTQHECRAGRESGPDGLGHRPGRTDRQP